MQFSKLILATLGLALFFAVGCKKEKEDPQETITTVVLHFTQSGGFSEEFTWENKSGGTQPETVDTIRISAGSTFDCHTHLYDRSGDNNEDIGEEVTEESAEHLLIYTASGADLTVSITDNDANGDPLGIDTEITTGQAGTGTLRVVLKHEPDKAATDPSLTGETDVDVTFPVVIE